MQFACQLDDQQGKLAKPVHLLVALRRARYTPPAIIDSMSSNLPGCLVLQERLSETHPLVNEAITDYARAMNKISFDHAVKTRSSGVPGLAMVPLDISPCEKSATRQVPCSASDPYGL